MTNDLKARLDAMVALRAHDWDLVKGSESGRWMRIYEAVALDILSKLDAEKARADAAEAPCVWSYSGDFEDAWDGACGAKWTFIEGGPIENEVQFCPGCGHPVQVKQSQDAAEGK